jgi:hypothetical protein
MAKKIVVAALSATNVVADAATQQNVVQYNIGKLPRNGLNEGTKHGQGGTAGTYKAVCAALADGPLSLEAIKTVCKNQGDAGFARYAVRNHWLLPVETK